MQKLNENHVIHGWRQMNANGSMCLDCEAHRGTWKINHLLFPSIHGLAVNESPGKVNLTPWLLGRHNKVDKFAALWKKIKLVTDSWFVTVIVDDSWNFVCRILKGSLNLTEVVSAVFSAPRWDAEENVGYLTVSGCVRGPEEEHCQSGAPPAKVCPCLLSAILPSQPWQNRHQFGIHSISQTPYFLSKAQCHVYLPWMLQRMHLRWSFWICIATNSNQCCYIYIYIHDAIMNAWSWLASRQQAPQPSHDLGFQDVSRHV